MKMIKCAASVLFAVLMTASTAFSQLSETWTAELNGDLTWQKITSDGTHIVATDKGLSSYDRDTGEQLWENSAFAGYGEEQMEELAGSPLLLLKKDGNVSIINPFDGTVSFNSKEAGIDELTFKKYLFRSNGIFVAGKTAEGKPRIVVVDNATGKERFAMTEDVGTIVSLNEIDSEEMLLAGATRVFRISSATGDVIWEAYTTAEQEQLADTEIGAMLGKLTESMAENVEFTVDYFQNLEKGIAIIAAEQKTESNSGSGTAVYYNTTYTAFRIADGSRVWEQPVSVKGQLGDLAFYGNGIIAMPSDGNKTAINYFEFEPEGKGKWGKKGRGVKTKGGVSTHIKTGDNYLLVNEAGSNTFLNLLDPAAGDFKYDKAVKVSGELVSTFMSDKGITYVTTEEVNMIDPVSGDQLLGKSIDTAPGLTAIEGDLLYVFDTKANIPKSVNFKTAEVVELSNDKIKFKKEDPTAIEKRDGGILVSGAQNMALVGSDGGTVFEAYFPAPSESGLMKALLVAQSVRAAYIGANAYAAAGAMTAASADVKDSDPVAGAVAEGFGMAYQEMGDQASDFVRASMERVRARSSATAEGRDYNIILTEKKKSNALIRVDKNTGEVDAEIDLGDNSDPKYAVDDVTGHVFVADEAGKISCYKF